MKTILLFCLIVVAWSKKRPAEPEYTQDVELFKKDQNVVRMQMMAGCWLIVLDELKERMPDHTTQNITIDTKTIAMLKKCMRKISLKEAVVKVTELVSQNMSVPKTFTQIVGNFSDEEVSAEMSEFDKYIATFISNYTQELSKMKKSDMREYLQSQLNKKTKYYFGIIPATPFWKMAIVAMLTLACVSCCTWCRFYGRAKQEKEKKAEKKQVAQKNDRDRNPLPYKKYK